MGKAPPAKNTDENLYHNTKKLLENYRTLTFILNTKQVVMNKSLEESAREKNCTVEQLLAGEALNGDECFEGRQSLQAQIRVLEKTLRRVNAAFGLLKKTPDCQKYYVLLRERYLEPPEPGTRNKDTWYIGGNEVPRTTYYRHLKKAVSIFDRLLWEISDTEVEAFLYNIGDILSEWYACKSKK